MPEASQQRLRLFPILTTATVLRLAVVLSSLRHDPRQWFYPQATELGSLANALLTGHGLASPFGGDTGPSAFLAPGYPALVALLFRIFGAYSKAAAIALLLLQVAFGVLTVLALMLAARKAFNTRTANLAGLIWALSPPLLFFPTLFWETGLSILLLTTFCALALRWVAQPKPWHWAAMGAYCALAMLLNPSLMLALFSIIAWVAASALRAKRICIATPLLTLLTFTILFAPWPIRNAQQLHALIPTRTNLGYELWQGNRPGSGGNFSPALHPNVNAEQFNRYATLGEVAYMREKSTLASAAIRSNPPRFVGLTALRTLKFWIGLGSHDVSALIVAYIVLTTALGLTGLIILWRSQRSLALLFALPLLLFPLPYYLTHPDFRFRLVLDPLLTILSAYMIVHWRERIRPPQHKLKLQ